MRVQGGRMLRLAMPFKAVVQRFAFLLLVGVSVAFLVLGKADVALVNKVRVAVTDLAAPVLDVVSGPVAAINRGVDVLEGLIHLRTDNVRLKEENRRLQAWQAAARRLEQENAVLRSLMQFQPLPTADFLSARVIGDSGGPFVRTLLVNAGSRARVEKGQAVVTGDGLIGRVVEVGERAARILLITDLNSRIPVAIEGTRHRAVLAGDNSRRPRLEFLPATAQVSAGDRIVTSGDGGLFPPGLPVGVVTESNDATVRVQAFADWDRVEIVRILRYRFPQLDAGPPGPGTESGAGKGDEAKKNKEPG